ncbi:hypothetical protein OHA40_16880 [Nocardia sp. NBC_00508]|uniref:hypothetical protein n=1 Tax=Nocardia sp. NBC_00508 TaxID=2975992 RepID=UPI002E81E312|nr:hypothetical protein [Nocardia sp. NBC_00508]WUD69642.1 hypothetical protein OHA40_16880 [Nocardia sp. NBC_00508]
MAETIVVALVAGVFALVGGVIGSIGAPWTNWAIQKRKDDRQHQRDLVDKWRNGIAELVSGQEANGLSWYESLRPHLSAELISKIEPGYGNRVIGIPINPDRDHARPPEIRELLATVDQLEKEWGLSGR